MKRIFFFTLLNFAFLIEGGPSKMDDLQITLPTKEDVKKSYLFCCNCVLSVARFRKNIAQSCRNNNQAISDRNMHLREK